MVTKVGRVWSSEEISFLKEAYDKVSWKEIAVEMKRSFHSVTHKARRLGLFKEPMKRMKRLSGSVDLNLTEWERGYLSAAIDGEGTITIIRDAMGDGIRLLPKIEITNTNTSFLKRLAKMAPSCRYRHRRKAGQKIVHVLCIHGLCRVYSVLKVIMNDLIIKRKQSESVFNFCKSRLSHPCIPYTKEEWEMYHKVKVLNRKGK